MDHEEAMNDDDMEGDLSDDEMDQIMPPTAALDMNSS